MTPPRLDIRRIRRVLERNLLLKVFSLVFAIGLWAFVNLGARDTEKTLLVPLELRNIPDQYVVTSPVVDSVDVRVRGPRTILGSVDDRRQRVVLDLANVRSGATSFKIDGEMLNLPRGVRVVRLSPVQVTLDVERMVRKTLPVAANLAGLAPAGYRLTTTEIRPASVLVYGPAREVETLKAVTTEPINLMDGANTFEEWVNLESPGDLTRLSPERVFVRGRLEEVSVSQDFPQVEIGVRNASHRVRIQPQRVDVRVRGPKRLLEGLKLSGEHVYVDVRGLAPGAHRGKIELALPDGVEALELRPAEVAVQVLAERGPQKRG
jgi:YbbR domain-containing protein